MKQFSTRIKSEEFREWNEKMVIKYDPDAFHHHPSAFVRFIESRRVKAIFKLLGHPYKGEGILEVGCGAGNILDKVPMGELIGVDISEFILAKAKQKLSKKVYLLQADAQNLPFKDQTFKQVICSEVLEHLLDPSLSLKEISRILNKFGIFDWLLHRRGGYSEMPENMEDEWHLHAFTLEGWTALFNNYFRVTHLRSIPFFWLPFRYVLRLEKN